jgi:hypothetical protein
MFRSFAVVVEFVMAGLSRRFVDGGAFGSREPVDLQSNVLAGAVTPLHGVSRRLPER